MKSILIGICLAFITAVGCEAATYTGKVTGTDGKPIAGAKVAAYAYCEGIKDEVRTETDKSGRFQVKMPDHKGHGGKCVGVFAEAYKSGWTPKSGKLTPKPTTLQLEPAGQVWGTVVDSNGRPVAGASVELIDVDRPDKRTVSYSCSMFRTQFIAKTTADGRWTIAGVPTSGTASVRLNDPRFASDWARVLLGADQGPATPLVARPGGEITGRVVYEGGKPAKQILISAQSGFRGNGHGMTGVDGRYRLRSLDSGLYNISAKCYRECDFTANGLKGIKVAAGGATQAPDIVMTRGAIIEGVITDKVTGKPRPGIRPFVKGPQGDWPWESGARAKVDKQGRYSVRVAPGKNTIQLFNESGFGRTDPEITVRVAPGEKKVLNIKVAQAVTVTGTLVDPAGKPVPDMPVNITVVVDDHNRSMGGGGKTNKMGRFTIPDMVAGKAEISVGQRFEGNDWEVVEPQKFDLPLSKPLIVKVRKANLLSLSGRALTAAGKPVSGVVVDLKISTPIGESGFGKTRNETVTSNAEGRFFIDRIRPEETELRLSAGKKKFVFISGGKITVGKGKLAVTDIIVAPLVGSLKGKVVDSGGNPVAGARVTSPDGDEAAKATSDAQGDFLLQSIPQGEVEVLAARGYDVGVVNGATDGQPVVIKLTPVERAAPGDIQRGYAILEEAWKESEGKDYWVRRYVPLELAPYDPDLALKMAEGADENTRDFVLAGTIATQAKIDPRRAAAWSMLKLDRVKSSHLRLYAAASLGLAVADSDPVLAGQLYSKAKSLLGPRSNNGEAVAGNGLIVALAAKLKNGEAESLLDKLLAGDEIKKWSGWRPLLSQIVAVGSPDLARRVALGIADPIDRGGAFVDAARVVARCDVKASMELLADMEKGNDPGWIDAWRGRAAVSLVPALGKSDPAEALSYARSIQDERYRSAALMLAASFQGKDKELQVLRAAADAGMSSRDSVNQISRAAARAYGLDPKVGLQLFDMAKRTLETDKMGESSSADIAYYYAKVDPAEARLMVEDYLTALRRTQVRMSAWNETRAAMVMAPLDLERALGLARAHPESDYARYDTRRKIAQYVLASEDGRRLLNFDLWVGANTWRPEMPISLGLRIWEIKGSQ